MPLQEMYYIAEMVVGVAVIISIVFVAIELRQNTYMLRRSMADQREERINWMQESIVLDPDFRKFHSRLSEWEDFDDDERVRGFTLGIRALRSLLNETVAYFDGQISENEFRLLKWGMTTAKGRPHIEAAYEFIKEAYPEPVQKFWEGLEVREGQSKYGEIKKALSRGKRD